MGPKSKQKSKVNKVVQETQKEKQDKILSNPLDKNYIDHKDTGKMRVEANIPFTDIPLRHYKSMLRKDQLGWRREWKRNMFEVLFPSLVIWILVIIRLQVKVQNNPSHWRMENYITFLGPWSTPLHTGISKDKVATDGKYNDQISAADMQIGMAMKKDKDHLWDFKSFTNRTEDQMMGANPTMQYLADNCNQPTIYNKARMKWGIIGDLEQENSILAEFNYTMHSFFYTQSKLANFIDNWHTTTLAEKKQEQDPGFEDEDAGMDPRNPFAQIRYMKNVLDVEPLHFKTYKEFETYVQDPLYELDEEHPGLCIALHTYQDLDSENAKKNGPEVIVRIYTETRDGKSPSNGGGDPPTQQTVVPSTYGPAMHRYVKGPQVWASELYYRQGYAYFHNWIANSALKVITGKAEARIDLGTVPMDVYSVHKDDFEQVMEGVYAYLALANFILPMYSLILRLQTEKQVGVKQHLSILGMSYKAQYLAQFTSYVFQVTLITFGVIGSMRLGDFFPKTRAKSTLLLFLFTWFQGVCNYGFIVLIVNLMPHDMYPKLAAKWGTLLYFCSAFLDLIIKKPGIAESTKVGMSLLFPNLATTRAAYSLVVYEFNPNGNGLGWDSTLWGKLYNYRVISYFPTLTFALIFHFTLGMLLEKYGSAPAIWRTFMRYVFAERRKALKKSIGKDETARMAALSPIDRGNFETAEDQDLIPVGPQGPASQEQPRDVNQLLSIHNLVKTFRQGQDGGTGKEATNYFTAVDHLSLNMRKGQIFAMLGHNGAGKTTTISMLTGMLEATGGRVTCFGRHMVAEDDEISWAQQKKDIAYIRQVTGICPQHDILFDLLTVYEHLDIYCDFKGVDPNEKEEKIQRIMKDVGVQLHKDTMAKDLSGGSKRKLSVALALVADSRLVLLDEPTSGMDLTARRRLWDMLKDYKQERIIILTTHNMDEADLLGDRIGIMSQGRLVCLGGPMFLKNRYGSGFKLEIKKKDANEQVVPNSRVLAYLKSNLGDQVKTLSDDSHACSFQIPKPYADKFQAFFAAFDLAATQDKLNIKTYGVSVTSLEEVFMRVGEEQGHHGTEGADAPAGLQDRAQLRASIGSAGSSDGTVVTLEESREINRYRRSQGTISVLAKQTAALMTRRLTAYSRNKAGTLFEMLVPVILIFVGLCFTRVNFLAEAPDRNLGIDELDWQQRVLVNTDLVRYHGARPGEAVEDGEDFGDDATDDEWPSHLPVDIDPLVIMEKLPGYAQGAYKFDQLNVTQGIEDDRIAAAEEAARRERERAEWAQLAAEEAFERNREAHERHEREQEEKRKQRYLSEQWCIIRGQCRVLAPNMLGNEHQQGSREEDGDRVCRKLAVEGLGADYRPDYYERPEQAAAAPAPAAAAVDAPLLPLVLAPERLDAADANAAAAAAPEGQAAAEDASAEAAEPEEPAPALAAAVEAHRAKKPEDYDMSPDAQLFKKYTETLYDSRTHNVTTPDDAAVFPYRLGSYYVYEANNKTKQFKIATFMNLTSQDVMALYPQYLYEAVLKTATGRDDLKFKVTTAQFPLVKKQRDREETASGIFVAFVVGVGMALIPASIVSRVVHEKERGLYHMQVVSGVSRRAYWGSFFLFDILQTYVPCFLAGSLFEAFGLEYPQIWTVLMLYPWAIVPYSYCTTFLFSQESTAQTFTIYLHFLGSGIAGMIIFALRMVPQTALWGDDLMATMRYVCPSFTVCNSIIWGGTRGLMRQLRDAQVDEAEAGRTGWERIPDRIDDQSPWLMNNVGGDMLALILGAVGWWAAFVILDRVPWSRIEAELEGTWLEQWLVRRYPQPRSDEELELDDDVIAEETRVQECEDHSVCVNRFRKVYAVPMSAPILAVERASFAVNDGECFALLGVNGAGKTTTFKSLTNAVEPTSGEIGILGRNISRDFNLVRHRIGYCPQHNCNFKSLNVYEHLKFYAFVKQLPFAMHERLINGVIQKLRLGPYKYKHADQLSGGNKRKLQTAIAILGNPLVVLLDEPSAGMDPAARRFMWKIVSGISKERQNTCVILTTHSMEEAEALSTKMGILVHGGIFRCMGTAHHIKNKFGSGYETLFKMKTLEPEICANRVRELGLVAGERWIIKDLIDIVSEAGALLPSERAAFEVSVIRQIFNINESDHSVEASIVTTEQLVTSLNTFKIRQEIIKVYEDKFQLVEVLESYGEQFFKVRIPPNEHSLGYMYGFVESKKKESWGLLQYQISQTSLEMIFNYFAKGGIGGREEILEAEENADLQLNDDNDQ